jgi:pSer/pThr/pTyr-binding forkhead associated (FHA) protein
MTGHLQPSSGPGVAIHLLDPAHGHPLQTWRFANQELITIGRNDGNDVVLADPHVSRAHATIALEEGAWRLISIGRHGTILDDRLVAHATLGHRSIFRLGTEGPQLQFETDFTESRRSETIDNVSADLLAMLEVDELRKQQDVEQIVGNPVFQELKQLARRVNAANIDDTAN